MANYYQVLGVEATATGDEIKTAYRKLSMKFHPDKNPGDKYFEDWSKKINEAYETLGNAPKKTAYDATLVEDQQRRNAVRDSNVSDHDELLTLRTVRDSLPEYFDAWAHLHEAQNKYKQLTEDESTNVIDAKRGVLCAIGIIVSILGLYFTIFRKPT